MYRVIIADDEILMLKSLQKTIETNFPEQFEIQTAKTGSAAVELVEEFHPDIVLMDIHMPGMNGIDAIRTIKEKYSNILFVVITAYDKFDYAKEALNLKVFDFIMKPVSRSMVIDLMTQIIRKLDEDKKDKLSQLRIQEKLDTVVPILESGLINTAILQDGSRQELGYYKELLDITEEYAYVMVLQFGEENHGEVLTNPIGMGVRARNYYGSIRDKILEFFDAKISPIISNRIIILVCSEKKEVSYEERVGIIEQARSLRKELISVFDAKYRIGIGITHDFDGLNYSYREAIKALQAGKSRVVHYEDIPEHQEVDLGNLVDMENELMITIRKGDAQMAKDTFSDFLQRLEQEYEGQIDMIRIKVLEIILISYRELSKKQEGESISSANYLMEVTSCSTVSEIQLWGNAKICQICNRMKENLREDTIVGRAKKYMKEHFQEDISLNDVAENAKISPYYFSKLFKEESGKNFIDYLTEIRLGEAKRLLRNPEVSIKEVCIMSGYGNPNYFSRIFKKLEGVTPSEYRERENSSL